MKAVLTILILAIGASPCTASLDWESLDNEVVAESGAKEVRATFVFRNNGDYTVNIGDIVPGCGCTTVEFEDKAIAPGESGEVTAIFNIGAASQISC